MGARGPKKGQFGKISASEMNPNSIKALQPAEAWEGPSQELWEDFLSRVSDSQPASKIIREEWPVEWYAFWSWMDRNPDRKREYDFARSAGLEAEGDRILEAAYHQSNVARAKVQIDAHRFRLTALHPKYKPKQDVNVTNLSDEELKEQLAAEIAALTSGGQETGDNT